VPRDARWRSCAWCAYLRVSQQRVGDVTVAVGVDVLPLASHRGGGGRRWRLNL